MWKQAKSLWEGWLSSNLHSFFSEFLIFSVFQALCLLFKFIMLILREIFKRITQSHNCISSHANFIRD